jgi:2-phosphoglycolate phosphatase
MLEKLPPAILFDLDGTLIDTAPEFLIAINSLLHKDDLPLMSLESVRTLISKGSKALVNKAYDDKLEPYQFDSYHVDFLTKYNEVLGSTAHLFQGMSNVLDVIETSGRIWGVVTNKPSEFTNPLLKKLNLYNRAACVISGDTTQHPKPHPAPLLKACSVINQRVKECIYIGDDERDIRSANAANMQSIIALYGYKDIDQHPEKWGASAMIRDPRDLIPALKTDALPTTEG